MHKVIRARFSDGVIVPLEELELQDGEEIAVIVTESHCSGKGENVGSLEESCGTWKGLVDTGELKKEIYQDRLITTRPRPDL